MSAPYQVLPPLTDDEYSLLAADIEANGVRSPIDVDEDGNVLDGHHRSRIAFGLEIECPKRIVSGLSEDEKIAHAFAVNSARRQLTRDDRQAMARESILRAPHMSDRWHAANAGVHHETIATYRAKLIDAGDVADSATRTDSVGRQQPSQKLSKADVEAQDVADRLHGIDPELADRSARSSGAFDRAATLAKYPTLDVPGAPDSDIQRLARDLDHVDSDQRERRAENAGKWLIAKVEGRLPSAPVADPSESGAEIAQAFASASVSADKYGAKFAVAWEAADELTRANWSRIFASALAHINALQQITTDAPRFRSVR